MKKLWTPRIKLYDLVSGSDGEVHWYRARGRTYCRRSTRALIRPLAGDAFLTCEACRDLAKIEQREGKGPYASL